jgi:hypothetical protein
VFEAHNLNRRDMLASAAAVTATAYAVSTAIGAESRDDRTGPMRMPKERAVDLASILKKRPLKDGKNLVARSPLGDSVFAVAEGGQITGWTITDRTGAEVPHSVHHAESASDEQLCEFTICKIIVIETDPPQSPPATAKECYTFVVPCNWVNIRIRPK